ncbi:MAG: rod shape-determining protein MreD [Candidatus Omnitrophota bacterium]|jgi:rod shape-determining protein MreD
MKTRLFLILIVVFALAQATILSYLKVFGVMPDILLAVVFIIAMSFPRKQALFLSVCAGMIKDVLNVYPVGINTLIFPLWCFIIMHLKRKISLEQRLFSTLAVGIITFCNGIITHMIFFFDGNGIALLHLLRIAVIESLYTALILPAVFKVSGPFLRIHKPLDEELKVEEA